MHLIDIENDDWIKISGFEGAIELTLRQYGLFLGDVARVVRKAPLDGPFLLEIGGREIALSRRIAAKIIVEPA